MGHDLRELVRRAGAKAAAASLFACVALLAPRVESLTSPAGPGHPGGLGCTTCHEGAADAESTLPGALRSSQAQLCGACHEGAAHLGHPTGFRPLRALPAGLPTDRRGELACSTCHELHADGEAVPGRASATGVRLCLACHDRGFFEAMSDGGGSLLGFAHLAADAGDQGPDGYSLQCLACHDAMIDAGSGVLHGAGPGNHPVGGDYAAAARYGGYRAPELLDRAIVLPAGRVSCLSCHIGYTSDHGAVVQTDGSLCSQCHEL